MHAEPASIGVGRNLGHLRDAAPPLDQPAHAKQIGKAGDRAINDSVFRLAVAASPIDNVEMAHGKSVALRQRRQKSVHRVEIGKAKKDVAMKRLEPTGCVASCVVQQPRAQPIGETRADPLNE